MEGGRVYVGWWFGVVEFGVFFGVGCDVEVVVCFEVSILSFVEVFVIFFRGDFLVMFVKRSVGLGVFCFVM